EELEGRKCEAVSHGQHRKWESEKVGEWASHFPSFSLSRLQSRGFADDSFALKIQIPPLHQRSNLAVGNRAFQHPKTAIRMDVPHAIRSEHFFRALDGASDFLRRLDVVRLDVHHAQADADPVVHALERVKIGGRA